MRLHTRPAAFIALCAVAAAAWLTARPDEKSRLADKYLRAQEISTLFSGSVLLARRGEVVFSGTYGDSDIERGTRNERRTQYRIGSITKSFTAALVLALHEEGLLAPTDAICVHLERCPAHWSEITIHHLLSHSSGIVNLTDGEDYLERTARPATRDEVLAEFRDAPLRFEPGSRFEYSNSNYHLLGMIVENVTGSSYAEALTDRVLAPLRLDASFMEPSSGNAQHVAVGYRPDDDGVLRPDSPLDVSWSFAAGGLFSTVDDLYRFSRALATGKLLSARSRELMWTPAAGTYGYGWNIPDPSPETLNRRIRMHSGRSQGYTACLVDFIDDELTAIVLSNNVMGDTCRIAGDLSAIVLDEPFTIPVARRAVRLDPAILDRHAGRYRLSEDATVVIERAGDSLVVQLERSPDRFQLLAESETEFFSKTSDVQIVFAVNRRGETTAATAYVRKQSFRIERLAD